MKRRDFLHSAIGGTTSLALVDACLDKSAQSLNAWSSRIQKLDESDFWRAVKQEFAIDPDIVHLNCGSIGASPKIVTRTLVELTKEFERNPFENFWGKGLVQRLEPARKTVAQFVNASVDEIALTRNTTEGMNLIARALDLKEGDEVVTSNREHPGGMACWNFLAKRIGIKIQCVRFPRVIEDESELIQLIRNKISDRTRVLSFCHIDSITGMILPVAKISMLARAHGIFFVCDGAQAPGMIALDVGKLKMDAYAASSHKWMSAPKETGFLYVNKASMDQLQSLELSTGLNVYSAANGTRNIPQILAHECAIKFQQSVGKAKIENQIRKLSRQLSQRMSELGPIQRLTPLADEHSAGLITFAVDKKNAPSHRIEEKLRAQFGIYVKAVPPTNVLNSDPSLKSENYNALRFSTHIFNDEKEIDRAVESLDKVLADF